MKFSEGGWGRGAVGERGRMSEVKFSDLPEGRGASEI